ncbi:MAG: tryptophan synthase subunit alpha [Oceanipulchritudo sp.]
MREIRKVSEVPIVLYTYYNLVFSQGLQDYARRAAEAGVDGILTLDLPPEEAGDFEKACEDHSIRSVYIVAPTSPEERIRKICDHATGFIYYVSQEGVTGERETVATNLEEKLSVIRRHARQPVVVGFGISKPEHVKSVGRLADGVVVGSALVNCIARNPGNPTTILEALAAKMDALCPGLKRE